MPIEKGAAHGLAATCMVESAEGPVAMSETPGKGFAVLTRLPTQRLGFRQLIKVVSREQVQLVRVILDSGHTVLAGADHPFYRRGGGPVPARSLAPGDLLETGFHYREGYAPPDVGPALVKPAIGVRAVEAAGEGPVLTGTVRDTHVLFLTAGVLCGE